MIKKLFLLLFFLPALSLSQEKNLAEKLGFDPQAKLLMLHADDIGVAHSVNVASFKAFESGSITSGSVMVPCPWFLEVVEYAKSNPDHDLGLHLTLTSEWKNYKWDGISSSSKIRSLINKQGHFYIGNEGVKLNATYEDVKRELRAQVNYSFKNGLVPTHLDTHMGTVRVRPEIFKAYFEIGQEFKIPVVVSKDYKAEVLSQNFDKSNIDASQIIWVDKIYGKSNDSPIDLKSWENFYYGVVDDLKPGFNILELHLGFENEELKAMMIDHPHWGAKWRELDLQIVESEKFKNYLKEKNIKLINWNQINKIKILNEQYKN